MQIQGILKRIFPQQSGTSKSGKAWQRVDVIIEGQGQYPDSYLVSAINERISELAGLAEGMAVSAIVNAHARETAGRWFNSMSLYKMTQLQQPQYQQPPTTGQPWQQQLPY